MRELIGSKRWSDQAELAKAVVKDQINRFNEAQKALAESPKHFPTLRDGNSFPEVLNKLVQTETFGKDPKVDVRAISDALSGEEAAQKAFWVKETGLPYASLRAAISGLSDEKESTSTAVDGEDHDNSDRQTKRARTNTIAQDFDLDE